MTKKQYYRQKQLKRRRIIFAIIGLIIVLCCIICKKDKPQIIGYTYDSGTTVWEMAVRCCPNNMDVREVVREIEKINGIENATVYKHTLYQVPIYEEVK